MDFPEQKAKDKRQAQDWGNKAGKILLGLIQVQQVTHKT